jgi:hypothetical protein
LSAAARARWPQLRGMRGGGHRPFFEADASPPPRYPDGGRAAAAGDAAAAAAEAAAGVERWRRGAREMAPVLLRAGGGAWKVADRLHGLEEKCDARCERSCVGPRRIDVRKLLNGRHQVVTRIFSA